METVFFPSIYMHKNKHHIVQQGHIISHCWGIPKETAIQRKATDKSEALSDNS